MANKYHNDMTEDDYEFIRNNYEKMTIQELQKHLKKSQSTIYKAIVKLKLVYFNREGKPWDENEVNFLKENYLLMTYPEIAIKLRRTLRSVQGKAHNLKLVKNIKNKNWTEEEIDCLKENITSKNYEEISKLINRTPGAIRTKCLELKLIPEEFKGQIKLKQEQIEFILANCHKMTDSQLALKFEVAESTIANVRKKFGIKKTGSEIKGPTYIEMFVKDLLDKEKIPYIYNQDLEGFRPDFQIKTSKILIEVQGDYFHCNPYVYKNGPKDEIQIRHIIRDYYKKCHFLSRGYTIIYIWEKDINENPQSVINIIKSIAADYGQTH